MALLSEQCPWCGSAITHEHFQRIERRIREEEKQKLAAAEKEMKQKLSAAEKELRARIEKETTAKLAAQEKKLAADRHALEADRAKLADDRRALAETSKRQVELARQALEKQKHKELADQRAILEKDRDNALLKKDAGFIREREGLMKKIMELTRKVEQKTAGEAGDGAEIDLFEELKAEFGGTGSGGSKRGSQVATFSTKSSTKAIRAGRS